MFGDSGFLQCSHHVGLRDSGMGLGGTQLIFALVPNGKPVTWVGRYLLKYLFRQVQGVLDLENAHRGGRINKATEWERLQRVLCCREGLNVGDFFKVVLNVDVTVFPDGNICHKEMGSIENHAKGPERLLATAFRVFPRLSLSVLALFERDPQRYRDCSNGADRLSPGRNGGLIPAKFSTEEDERGEDKDRDQYIARDLPVACIHGRSEGFFADRNTAFRMQMAGW